MIKIWVDDIREKPEDYEYQLFTVANANAVINIGYHFDEDIFISLDHDAGKYVKQGGDYIKILERLEEMCYNDPNFRNYVRDKVIFHLHTANPVGRANMRRIIQKNGWREV